MAKQNKETTILIRDQGVVYSIIEDSFTFGGFMAILWFNHKYLGGSGWIDFMFVVLWIMSIAKIQTAQLKRFYSKKEAIDFLKK